MSETHSVKNLLTQAELIGQSVTVKGWLRSKRDSKAGISFLSVNDGSHFDSLQCIAAEELENYSDILTLSTGCAVVISGELVASQGGGQAVEIQASTVAIIGEVDDPETYPITKKRHTFEYLRTQAHLRTRTNTFGAVTRIRHTLGISSQQLPMGWEAVVRWSHSRVVQRLLVAPACDLTPKAVVPWAPADHALDEAALFPLCLWAAHAVLDS